MEIVAPLGLLAVGFLTCWAWQRGRAEAQATAAYLHGYHVGWAARGAAIARALPGPGGPATTRLADAIREAEERLSQ